MSPSVRLHGAADSAATDPASVATAATWLAIGTSGGSMRFAWRWLMMCMLRHIAHGMPQLLATRRWNILFF